MVVKNCINGLPLKVTILVAALFLLGGAATSLAEEVTYKTLGIGEKAPSFKSTTVDGQPFDLNELLSRKNVVLFFWSLFCSPCREEMPLIQKLYGDLKEKQVEIVGVNLDEPALHTAIKSFLRSSNFSYPIIVNKTASLDAQTDKLYLITATPVVYMIKQDGQIAFAHVGRLEVADLLKAIEEKLLVP